MSNIFVTLLVVYISTSTHLHHSPTFSPSFYRVPVNCRKIEINRSIHRHTEGFFIKQKKKRAGEGKREWDKININIKCTYRGIHMCMRMYIRQKYFSFFFFLDKIKLMRWFSNYQRTIASERYVHTATLQNKKKLVSSGNEKKWVFFSTWYMETKAHNIVDIMWIAQYSGTHTQQEDRKKNAKRGSQFSATIFQLPVIFFPIFLLSLFFLDCASASYGVCMYACGVPSLQKASFLLSCCI